jgi:hypothetical protein
VSVSQIHSPFPSESFRLLFGPEDTGDGVLIPYDAVPEAMEKSIESYFPDDAVNVSAFIIIITPIAYVIDGRLKYQGVVTR